MYKYLDIKIIEDIDGYVPTFEDLAELAVRALICLPQPVVAISGPISTGGLGSIERNLQQIRDAVALFGSYGVSVFDNTPFEDHIFRLRTEWKRNNPDAGYCMEILEIVYRKLFDSGLIKGMIFLPEYKSSFGARWEHNECNRLRIRKFYAPSDWRNNRDFVNEVKSTLNGG